MAGSSRLPKAAVILMDDAANTVEVSAVSVWEVTVKYALHREGRLGMPMSGRGFLAEIRKVGLEPQAITADHAAAVDGLPLHHRDPFDRLLVAQSRCESMHLLTHDAKLAAYGDFVIVV